MLATGVQQLRLSAPAPAPVAASSPVPGRTSDCKSLGRNLQHKFPAAIRLLPHCCECVCNCAPFPSSLSATLSWLKFSALPCLISFRMIIVRLPLVAPAATAAVAAASYNVFPFSLLLLLLPSFCMWQPQSYYSHIGPSP